MVDADAKLLSDARAGDESALEMLLERHQAQVYRFGMKMCRDPEDAKDVLQDTLLAMARSVRDFRGASSISTWIYTIARNFCVKKRRKGKFDPSEERSLDTEATREAGDLIDPSQGPEDAVASKQVQLALEQALEALDPTYREVLVLRDMEGLSAREAAEVLAISVDAVKSRLHRARLQVRAELAPLLGIRSATDRAASTCPDVLSLFSRYLEDDISPEVCATMEEHVRGCERCREACDSLKQTLSLCRTCEASVAVPADVQASVRAALRGMAASSGG